MKNSQREVILSVIDVEDITMRNDNDGMSSKAPKIVRKPEDGNDNDVGMGDSREWGMPINQGGDDNGSGK